METGKLDLFGGIKMPNKVEKFKVCIKCDGCIPVIPESNFQEI